MARDELALAVVALVNYAGRSDVVTRAKYRQVPLVAATMGRELSSMSENGEKILRICAIVAA